MGLTGTDPFLTMNKLAVDIKKSAFSGSIALQLGDFDAAPNLSNAAYIPNNPVNNWYNKVLSSTTFSTINKKGVTQFRLRFTTDDDNNLAADYLAFYTGNNGLARRPQLVLTFHAP